MEVTIGGERLGAGKRNKVQMHNYERSTHDLSYIWRSTMASGTLVPFMSEVALPGDTFDIELNAEVLTHPTIGPLFGTYKIQLDVFQIPMRLYQGALHMNMLGIGMDMSKIKLPYLVLEGNKLNPGLNLDNQQINPSCLYNYLGIRGIGYVDGDVDRGSARQFNAIPLLAYWDIYKNYYANKQEEIGAVIHKSLTPDPVAVTDSETQNSYPNITIPSSPIPPTVYLSTFMTADSKIRVNATGLKSFTDLHQLKCYIENPYTNVKQILPATELFAASEIYPDLNMVILSKPKKFQEDIAWGAITYDNSAAVIDFASEPEIVTFPLSNIDDMRIAILQHPMATPFEVGPNSPIPYSLPAETIVQDGYTYFSKQFNQENLALKTYQSDLFNNWISTEWIDGPDGISEVTAIDTTDGSFTIDELNLASKIYNMLNRIALSGGSYDDWLDAVYTHDRTRSAENPMYIGGLIKTLVFQEVVSNAAAGDQPLGSLAGRGRTSGNHKGGQIIAKIDEPSYLMGIISITPNIDYSQGNKWDMNLKTMNDLHKPALDAIGFQDLITDQMAWYDTRLSSTDGTTPIFKSAGKQPAWINYMTNINQVKGNFADVDNQMYMVLNRRYDAAFETTSGFSIKDLTTYIDPTKFNHVFAQTSRDSQNFWSQISINMKARRKMSAKVIPNL